MRRIKSASAQHGARSAFEQSLLRGRDRTFGRARLLLRRVHGGKSHIGRLMALDLGLGHRRRALIARLLKPGAHGQSGNGHTHQAEEERSALDRGKRRTSLAARLGQSSVAARIEDEMRVTAADFVDSVAEARSRSPPSATRSRARSATPPRSSRPRQQGCGRGQVEAERRGALHQILDRRSRPDRLGDAVEPVPGAAHGLLRRPRHSRPGDRDRPRHRPRDGGADRARHRARAG
jgi:hypothetical protein